MLQSVPTSQPLNPGLSGCLAEPSSDDPLLDFAGSIAGSHALVISPNGLDLMCRLLRRGCAAATTLRPSERFDHETYDLILAPRVVLPAQIGRLIFHAKRALVPTGRFLAFVPANPIDPDGDVAGHLQRSVKVGGFAAVQTREREDGMLLRADLPMYGRSNAMPAVVRRRA